MTWQTAAVRYVAIGEKSARFRDLTLPFNADGEPVETVIWLPNGGGKSSLMSLKSAVVLPASRDFTGAGREDGEKRPRRLDDYVASGDTSHTVIDWVRDDTTNLLGGQHRLLTGAVYEWPDRHRPTLDQSTRLDKIWWSAVPVDGLLELDQLPVRDGRLLTMNQFHDRMRALNGKHPELQIQFARTQREWEAQLEKLGIDTALYRYQAKMNTSEGGIAKVFNFNTVRDFIDLVVDVVAAPDQATDCGNVVNEHAKNLFRRPGLLTEQAFLTEAHQLLTELDTAHEVVHVAIGDRDAARTSAQRLRVELTHAAARHEAGAQLKIIDADRYQRGATEARAERGRVDGIRAELLVLAATEEHAEAGRTLTNAIDSEEAARDQYAAWAAAAPLAEAAGHDAVAAELREQLKPERAAREELRSRVDAHALATRDLLEELARTRTDQAQEAAAALGSATDRRGALVGKQREARSEENDAHKAEATATALLAAHDRSVAAARRDGHLDDGETPADALNRHTAAQKAAEDAAEEHDGVEREHREAATAAGTEIAAASGDHARLVAEAREVAGDEERLQRAHAALAEHPRLLELGEADGAIDVWGDAATLRRRLDEAARKADDDALRTAVDAAEDDRRVAAVDTTGLLPAPVATVVVIDQLTSAGVVCETAWTVLARDYALDARARAVTVRPDVVSGVVLQTPADVERARAILIAHPTLAHIPLVTVEDLARATGATSADEGAEELTAGVVSVPLHDGLHVADAASAAAERLRSLGQSRQQHQAALAERAASDRALLGQLADFLTTHPDADSLARAARLTATARAAAEKKLADKTRLAKERDEHDQLAARAREQADAKRRTAAEHRSAAVVVGRLAESEGSLAEHEETRAQAAAALLELGTRLERLAADISEADGDIAAAKQQRHERDREAVVARKQLATIRVLNPDAEPPAAQVTQARALGLTQCQATYETLIENWRSENSASVLEAKLSAAEEQAGFARQRAERALTSARDRDAVNAVAGERAARHDADTCEREAAAAHERLEQAISAVATRRAGVDQAQRLLTAAIEERRTKQRPAEPVDFTTVDAARARAAELAAEVTALTATETELTRSRDTARQEATAESELAENLQDQAERLPALDADTAAATDTGLLLAFDGDLPEARRRVKAAVERLKRTEDEVTAAREQRAGYTREALKLATNPAYQNLALTLRERLQDGDPDRLGAKATDYLTQVDLRLDQVGGLLEQMGEDERRVSQLVATHVRQLLSTLQTANRASVLPPGLGELSGKRFIHLRFNDPTDEELSSRVTQEVLAMLDNARGDVKSLPGGDTILRRCVHAAVGVKSFRVDVLKPNEHMVEQRVDVVDVARFSDGEKLTACVLLFCAFARMRQRGRTGGATGTLMLDNPFGRASNAQLVALQLAVAKAQRVHLVYATGLEDMGALLQFRRLIRLRNRKPVSTSDGHVQLEETRGARIGEVSGVGVARATAPVPPGLTSPDEGDSTNGADRRTPEAV